MMIDSVGWSIFEVVINVIENLMIMDCLTRCFARKHQDRRHDLFFWLFFVLLLLTITIINFVQMVDQYLVFLAFFLCVAYCRINLVGRVIEHIVFSMAIVLSIMITSNVGLLICTKLLSTSIESLLYEPSFARMTSVIICKLLFFSFTRVLCQIRKKQEYSLPKLELIPAVVIPAISATILVFVMDSLMYIPASEYGLSFVAILAVIVINALVFFLVSRLNQQHTEKTEWLVERENFERYQQEIESAKEFFDQANKTKHDLQNFSIGLKSLLEQNRLQEAAVLVDRLTEQVGDVKTYVQSPYLFVNAIVNNKLSRARSCGIETHCQFQFELGRVEEMDLGRILGNLLDNAMEALATCGLEHPSLRLLLESRKDYLIVEVQNTIGHSVLEQNPTLKTTKTMLGHGVGLSSVRDIADRYEGVVQYSEEDSCFIALVMLGRV